MKRLFSSTFLIILCLGFHAQLLDNYEYLSMNPQIGIGIGANNYRGELYHPGNNNSARSATFGSHFFYMHPLTASVVAKANVNFHTLSQWGVYNDSVMNFQTNLFGLDIGALYKLDNDIILDQQKSFSIFLGGGAGASYFNVKSDLRDADGELYNYWSDGTIRTVPEDIGTNTSNKTIRDYDYETDIETEGNIMPYIYLEAGFGLKITHNLVANFSYKHIFGISDEIDGAKFEKPNDMFGYFNASLGWSFGKPTKSIIQVERERAAETIDQTDLDGDGVIDLLDECAKTPAGWEVDSKGCAVDDDGDGVPNAIDVENDSPKGSTVNAEGRALTDEEIEVMYLLQTGQMSGHERFEEWKAKYPELFSQYFGKTTKSVIRSEEEE